MSKKKYTRNVYLPRQPWNRSRWIAGGLAFVCLALVGRVLFLGPSQGGTTALSSHDLSGKKSLVETVPSATSTESAKQLETSASVAISSPPPPPAPVVPRQETLGAIVAKGDTVSAILDDYLSPLEIHTLGQACKPVFPLTKIRTGHPYRLLLQEKDLIGLEYEINDEHKLLVRCTEDGFEVTTKDIHYDIVPHVIEGTIAHSLSLALDEQGEGPELASMMEDIFGWDINFARDIRQGDSFKLLVEKRFRQGKGTGYGHILAAIFTSQDTPYQAYRFTDTDGHPSYYDQDGRSMRKAFLKAPLSFTRISSTYSNRRFHPILKVWRPHHGVDYAAPRGTPIKTVGDGVITAKRYDKAAGRYIKIRHAHGYETVYNHMSRYASGMHRGKRVIQGQVIGYVGATGYATGPHLDYRVKKNGQYINPLHMKSPPTSPVSKKNQDRFTQEVAVFDKQLMSTTPAAPVMQAGVKSLKSDG